MLTACKGVGEVTGNKTKKIKSSIPTIRLNHLVDNDKKLIIRFRSIQKKIRKRNMKKNKV